MNHPTRLATTVIAAATAVALPIAGVAAASPSDPTVGDTIKYVYYSDYQVNESVTWFDADSEIRYLQNAKLPARTRDGSHWQGAITVTSRSTYQPTAGGIQTSGYYAACRVYVNGTLTSSDSATGRYAVATC